MRLIAEIDDFALGLCDRPDPDKSSYGERHAARAVIFDGQGRIALLHSARLGYWKLPGGGIEDGEDWQQALLREALEETGYPVMLRAVPPLMLIEWRAQPEYWRTIEKLKQISVCGVADVCGDVQAISLTDDEMQTGLVLEWHRVEEAVKVMEASAPDTYEGKFIRLRDLTFLRALI